jgi:cytochrome P450 family 6
MALLFSSWWVELAAVVVTLLAGIYLYVTTVCYQYWKKRGMPHLEPSFPFGNIKDMVMQRISIAQNFSNMYNKLSGNKIAGLYQFWKPAVIVLDPEMAKHILVKDFSSFHDHGNYVDTESDPLSGHLFSYEGNKWKQLRNKLTPTFTSGKLKTIFPTIVNVSKELHKYLDVLADKKESIEVGT